MKYSSIYLSVPSREKRAGVQALPGGPGRGVPLLLVLRVRREAGRPHAAAVRRVQHGVPHLLPQPAARHYPRRRGLVSLPSQGPSYSVWGFGAQGN